MQNHWLSPFARHLALREWLVMFASLLLLTVLLGWQNGLGRLDQSLYDLFLSSHTEPVRDDIIIVAIDDYSIAELGRWPWPRSRHADLIDQISRAKPLGIGLDVILSEPEITAQGDRTGDAHMAAALRQNGRTVLPVVMTSNGRGLTAGTPIPELIEAAGALGHIDLEHDSDGVVRSVYLREGQYGQWWPHFTAALAAIGSGKDMRDTRRLPDMHVGAPDEWQRADRIHIPFNHGIGQFPTVPYVAVLRGEVPDDFLAGKYILIGATALGMADSYPTPVSGSQGAMPGVEIHANVLSSLLDKHHIGLALPAHTALFNLMPVFIVLLGYLLFSPRASLVCMVGGILVILGASYMSLRVGTWLPPSASIVVLLVSYPLWSWRRLEAAITYLGQEFIRLDREPHLLPEPPASPNQELADMLTQRISAMKRAARRVRDLRQFVSDSLDSLPDATLVTNVDGSIVLANRHAIDYCRDLDCHVQAGESIFTLLEQLNHAKPLGQLAGNPFKWADLFDLQQTATFADGISAQDARGRDLLIKSAPSHSSTNALNGWIVNIVDISTIRAAERSRDETLRFLSHDMRGPQASILALLELQSETASALPLDELFARIEKASRRTLGLADNFVQLARAESDEYRFEEMDFHDLMFDAADEIWSLAKSKHITVQVDNEYTDCPVSVDRTLVTRAITNLLSNAIAYSPEHTTISCTVHCAHGKVICSIRDQGYGIAQEDQARLFRRFQHMESPNLARHDGVGLGLVFVKTVVERHQGDISFTSELGKGTTFTLSLPVVRDCLDDTCCA
ncbi:CHASE2 and HATPase_c domain-containing protein [uncultured Oxalicibacterium sp.]|uniref:CHASE2 and HATPase_c domain-containing protein n=1 Tax=uncultured Oxalicibacterium sp. TaxID=1168540 RepID=UPI0025CE5CB6|nr:CHASE2 and HATPase_c domain-containing protein [uncultured Oxalicibacterium sp.]